MGLASDLIQRVQVGLKSLQPAVTEQLGEGAEFIRKHPVTSAVTVGGGVLAATQVIRVVRKKRKAAAKTKKRKPGVSKKKRKPTKKRSKRSWQLDRARISKQKHEVAYQKRKKRLAKGKKKRVGKTYYTKKGQPYKILASGKAKFIKKTKRRRR